MALTVEEEKELFDRAKQGDINAKDIIIEKNMGLVYKEAKKHTGCGLELEDLVQEGCIGLLKAINKFDVMKGCKFSTYATWWVRQTIGRAITNYGRSIRLPANIDSKLNKIKSAKEKIYSECGENPKNEDVANALNVRPEHIENILGFDYGEFSLDYPLGDDGVDTFCDFIVDENAFVEDKIFNEMVMNELKKILNELSEREKEIIKMSFGFYGERYYLRDISQRFGISIERTRQIRDKVIRKLKYGKYKRRLNELIKN